MSIKLIFGDETLVVECERLKKLAYFESHLTRWAEEQVDSYEMEGIQLVEFQELLAVANGEMSSTELLIRSNIRASEASRRLMDYYGTSEVKQVDYVFPDLRKPPSLDLLQLLRPYHVTCAQITNKASTLEAEYLRVGLYTWSCVLEVGLKYLCAGQLEMFQLALKYAQERTTPSMITLTLYTHLITHYSTKWVEVTASLESLGLFLATSAISCEHLTTIEMYDFVSSRNWTHQCGRCFYHALTRNWPMTTERLSSLFTTYPSSDNLQQLILHSARWPLEEYQELLRQAKLSENSQPERILWLILEQYEHMPLDYAQVTLRLVGQAFQGKSLSYSGQITPLIEQLMAIGVNFQFRPFDPSTCLPLAANLYLDQAAHLIYHKDLSSPVGKYDGGQYCLFPSFVGYPDIDLPVKEVPGTDNEFQIIGTKLRVAAFYLESDEEEIHLMGTPNLPPGSLIRFILDFYGVHYPTE